MNYDNEIRVHLSKSPKFRTQLKTKDAIRLDEWKIVNSRIDIAVVNGLFVGYEIKSKKDTLEKLEKQVKDYLQIFDFLTIVIDEKHLKKIGDMIPEMVGIMIAGKGFPLEREAKINLNINHLEIAQLLWKEELLEILSQQGYLKIKSKRRDQLAEIFVNHFGNDTPTGVRENIKKRYFQTQWRNEEVSIWQKYLDNPQLLKEL